MTRMCAANWKCTLSPLSRREEVLGVLALSFRKCQIVQEFSQTGVLNYKAATVG